MCGLSRSGFGSQELNNCHSRFFFAFVHFHLGYPPLFSTAIDDWGIFCFFILVSNVL